MTKKQIRDQLVGRAVASLARINSTWSNSDVAWPNKKFKAENRKSWMKLDVLFGAGFGAEKGGGVAIRVGVLILSFFGEKGVGQSDILTQADNAETVFRQKDIGGVILHEPNIAMIGPEADTNYYRINVSIPFNAFVGE